MNQHAHSPENSIGRLVSMIARMIAHDVRQEFEEQGIQIPPDNWVIIIKLADKDGLTQQELAHLIFKDKGTVTRALRNLEKHDLITRIEHPADKRNKLIYLTPKGKKQSERLFPLLGKIQCEALQGIDSEHVNICRNVLKQIVNNFNHKLQLQLPEEKLIR